MIGGEVQRWNLTQRVRTKSFARAAEGVVLIWPSIQSWLKGARFRGLTTALEEESEPGAPATT